MAAEKTSTFIDITKYRNKHDRKSLLGSSADLSKPKEIGSFSLDSNRKFANNRSQLAYLEAESNLSKRMDLSDGYKDRFIKRDDGVKERLDNLLRWIVSNLHHFHKNDNNQNDDAINKSSQTFPDFILWRGHMTKIMCTPYENQDGWIMAAQKLGPTIYISEIETAEAEKRRMSQTEKQKIMTYWGVRFEKYMTRHNCSSSRENTHKVPRLMPIDQSTVTVNTNEAFCTVLKAHLNSHTIIHSAEVDCCANPDLEHHPPDNYIELKTSREFSSRHQEDNFHRYKTRKWWAQSYLAGVPQITCGFRDDSGIVVRITDFKTADFPRMARNVPGGGWDANVSLLFLREFFDEVKNAFMKEDTNDSVILFSWNPGENRISMNICKKSEQGFLPDCMRYVSTRGGAGYKTYEEVLFTGYAEDGGFFVPEHVPKIDPDTLKKWKHLSYPEIVAEIISCFVTEEEIPPTILRKLLANAHSRFDVEEVVKVSSYGDLNIAELYHGPTMAFKDLAMLCVGEFYQYFLSKQNKHATAVVVTTGDTGSSAIEAVRGKDTVDLIVIYPYKRITQIQELMTTTILDDNIHVYADKGDIEDLEVVTTNIFADAEYSKKHNLCSINSINWTRVMIQAAHYVYVYLRTVDTVGNPIDVVVPSGGCGNIAAGVYAVELGVPINFICALNENDIVHRALRFNDFKKVPETKATFSSSIDSQMPYNIERILWLYSGGDAKACKEIMEPFARSGETQIPQDLHDKLSNIRTVVATDEIVLTTMKMCYDQIGYIACPHTAVALSYYYGTSLHGSRQSSGTRRDDGELVPIVILATAAIHKFTECLEKSGINGYKAPDRIADLFHKKTRCTVVEKGEDWEKLLRDKLETISRKITC